MKRIDQVAIATKSIERAKIVMGILGWNEWSDDEVHAEGTVNGKGMINAAHLAFNYQVGNFEFEFLEYKNGVSWHDLQPRSYPFLSHFGIHAEDPAEFERLSRELDAAGYKKVQEVETFKHTNPVIAGKRRYLYRIYNTSDDIGFDIKLILRLSQ